MHVNVKAGSGMVFAKLANKRVRFGRSEDAAENEAFDCVQFQPMPKHMALIGSVETLVPDEQVGHGID